VPGIATPCGHPVAKNLSAAKNTTEEAIETASDGS